MTTASRRLSSSGSLGPGQFDVLERIASGVPATAVLTDLVALVESQAPDMACSVQVLDDDTHTRIAASICQSLPPTLSSDLIGMPIGPTAGSCGAAAWSGERVVVSDISTHPNWVDHAHRALPYGWRACWSNPIKSAGGTTLGTFAMYYREIRVPTPQEERWVDTATQLAAIALERAQSVEKLERRIAAHRADQERLERLTRFLAVSSHVNEAMVRERELDRLYQRICSVAVEHGKIHMAWVGLKGSDGLVRPAARAGAGAAYLDEIELRVTDPRMAAGPAGRAVLRGESAVSHDIAADDTFVWRSTALAHGLRSCATFPLTVDGEHIGLFAVYADQPDVFNDDEVQVLAALAENLSFAMESARREDERQTAVEERKKAEAQLLRAQRLESIGTLAGGIAHDFNNILTSIVGNAGLASAELIGTEETGADADTIERVLDSIEEIEKAGARASDLVSRILTFSRPQEPERTSIDVAAIADEALELLRATLPAMIQIRREYADNVPMVMADATQIHQVLMNLCTNSAHAMGDTAGVLTVRVAPTTVKGTGVEDIPGTLAPGLYVKVGVSDTGCGVDTAVADRIFEPFFTTKEASQGTGLGLSVVHGIVRNHDGAIRLKSAPGQGALFEFWLPVSARAPEVVMKVQGDSQRGQGQRLIVVDDEPALVALHGNYFTRLGYVPWGTTDAHEALARIQADPACCDVLLTDSAMPGMTGFDLIRAVRAIRADLPVILMSGFFRATDLEAAAELGVTMWQKPGRSGDLARLVARLLG